MLPSGNSVFQKNIGHIYTRNYNRRQEKAFPKNIEEKSHRSKRWVHRQFYYHSSTCTIGYSFYTYCVLQIVLRKQNVLRK